MFARASGPEVLARDDDRCFRMRGVERLNARQSAEAIRPESLGVDGTQIARRDDLIGVDVGSIEREERPFDDHTGTALCSSSGLAIRPSTALAATTTGE